MAIAMVMIDNAEVVTRVYDVNMFINICIEIVLAELRDIGWVLGYAHHSTG